jgi:ABC-type histidine transport system ATPase subunit
MRQPLRRGTALIRAMTDAFHPALAADNDERPVVLEVNGLSKILGSNIVLRDFALWLHMTVSHNVMEAPVRVL